MANIAEELRPGFFFVEGLAAYVSGDLWVGPHRGTVGEVAQPVAAQFEAGGFEDWHFYGCAE